MESTACRTAARTSAVTLFNSPTSSVLRVVAEAVNSSRAPSPPTAVRHSTLSAAVKASDTPKASINFLPMVINNSSRSDNSKDSRDAGESRSLGCAISRQSMCPAGCHSYDEHIDASVLEPRRTAVMVPRLVKCLRLIRGIALVILGLPPQNQAMGQVVFGFILAAVFTTGPKPQRKGSNKGEF